jgi:hypothetical protein
MLGNGAAATPGQLSNHFAKHQKSSGNELVALVEVRHSPRLVQVLPAVLPNHIPFCDPACGVYIITLRSFNPTLLQASADSTEAAVSEHLGAHAKLAWCNSVDTGRFLVRFLSSKDLETAADALHGSSWMGEPFTIVPAGQLLSGAAQQDR